MFDFKPTLTEEQIKNIQNEISAYDEVAIFSGEKVALDLMLTKIRKVYPSYTDRTVRSFIKDYIHKLLRSKK